jgi:hypothetical protein
VQPQTTTSGSSQVRAIRQLIQLQRCGVHTHASATQNQPSTMNRLGTRNGASDQSLAIAIASGVRVRCAIHNASISGASSLIGDR